MSDIDDELFALAGGDEEADIEEGEASSPAASDHSELGSDAMEESDSDRDDDAPAPSSDVPYPLEGKYVDEADKRRIMAMSQLDREEILGQRAEDMSKANFTAELARRAANMQNERKRKLDADEPDETRRPKVKARVNDKLEEYKRNREQRGQQRDRDHDRDRDADRRAARRGSSSADRGGASDVDVDADGESDVEWDERAPAKPRDDVPATLRDLESVRVGRGFFSEVCFYPGFEDAVTGTFGRVGVGQDAQRRTMYKMAQIKGNTGKPYVFEGKNGAKIATDQYVIAQHGATKKEYQFQFLSNQRFDERDLDVYTQSLAESGAKLATKAALERKYDDLRSLHNHHWTEAEVNARIAKKKQYEHLLHRSAADAQPRIQTQSEVAAIKTAELNRANRIKEAERVRKVQLEQQRQKKMEQKKEAARKRVEEEARKALEDAQLNTDTDALFADDGASAPSSRASTPKPGEKKTGGRKGLPTFRKPKTDDDFIANMDLDIDIAI
ncbi:plus-3-domain-containing protein [Didymella exigua CBS 183.55]|uniref:Plus-3-domain-containing protein n=1 Tax=Didymella exigua CBS 183.55 TaxID=1150837 RepID=A0A6A5RND2_9PLEO|nr:plus-3-domain-containing protein [Didymella exigua CBS 183.55]KAF1929915.1 plus-3-domain-containing protein [Didymella exigua CBS 183.55]